MERVPATPSSRVPSPMPGARPRTEEIRSIRSWPRPDARDADASDQGFRLGWKTSLLLNLMLLSAPIGLVIALPPLLECRERAERIGFFSGETLGNCTERGVRDRLKRLDDRLKMLVRGSGR